MFTLRFPTSHSGTTNMLLTSRYLNTTALERHIEDGPVQGTFYPFNCLFFTKNLKNKIQCQICNTNSQWKAVWLVFGL